MAMEQFSKVDPGLKFISEHNMKACLLFDNKSYIE